MKLRHCAAKTLPAEVLKVSRSAQYSERKQTSMGVVRSSSCPKNFKWERS